MSLSADSRFHSSATGAAVMVPLLGTVAGGQRPAPGVGVALEVLIALGITLVVGGGLIVFAPNYTERTTRRILNEPFRTFLYGFGIGLVLIVVLVVLFLSVVGILLAIPLLVGVIIVGELGYLAAGRTLTESWGGILFAAMAVAAVVVGVPILGGVIGWLLSSLGIGAAYLDVRDDDVHTGQGTRAPVDSV